MIYVKLQGRLGNMMFCLAAAATLAKKAGTQFCGFCHNDYRLVGNISIWDYVQEFKENIFKGIEILEQPPSGKLTVVKQHSFNYSELVIPTGDFILEGSFQSYKYCDPDIIQNLFDSPEIKKQLLQENKVAFSAPLIGVHVRRGDYCYIPHKFPPISKKYIRKAMGMFPDDSRFLFISDDIDYCKKSFPESDNIFYLRERSILKDLYAPTLCEHNIISNSTFTWWGAYLNPNPTKKVIAPTPWFGPYIKIDESELQDILPSDWTQIINRLDFDLQLKAWRMGLFTILGILK